MLLLSLEIHCGSFGIPHPQIHRIKKPTLLYIIIIAVIFLLLSLSPAKSSIFLTDHLTLSRLSTCRLSIFLLSLSLSISSSASFPANTLVPGGKSIRSSLSPFLFSFPSLVHPLVNFITTFPSSCQLIPHSLKSCHGIISPLSLSPDLFLTPGCLPASSSPRPALCVSHSELLRPVGL